MTPPSAAPRVAIVGGGLAGLAAAVALADADVDVQLHEARRQLGGRAASFVDPATNEHVDYCQHVSMGCCPNFADFVSRTDLGAAFHVEKTLHFVAPDGRVKSLAASRLLAAPLHLAPSLFRLPFLGRREKFTIARTLLQLMQARHTADDTTTFGQWLKERGNSPHSVSHFWDVVLASALSAGADKASFRHARQVFVRGFLATRRGYEVWIPRQPLSRLFDDRLARVLAMRGVNLVTATPVRHVAGDAGGVRGLELATGGEVAADAVIVAVPWQQLPDILPAAVVRQLPGISALDELQPSPITGIHLWFDRSITDLPHAVLVGRLSQWVFRRDPKSETDEPGSHYYQVVVSAAWNLSAMRREEIVEAVCRELAEVFPAARQARLVQLPRCPRPRCRVYAFARRRPPPPGARNARARFGLGG